MVVLAVLVWFATPARSAEPASPETLALGVNVIGGQIDYAFNRAWRGELRFVSGSQESSVGTVSSQVVGLRAYRLFGASATRFYAGAEAAFIRAKQNGSGLRTTGGALGGFIGLERRIARRVALGVDAGPYAVTLRESASRASSTSVEFVLNTFILFYVY